MPETPSATPPAGWPGAGSPFHPGEQAVQTRLGVREQVEKLGRRMIRDHLPEQHRAFYAALPFVLVGSADPEGRPWASILAGPPGFITSPDPRRMLIAARPPEGDPLGRALRPGTRLAILGLQPETRRRNRLTGRVRTLAAEGFVIDVDQTFGNCPQYIQTRAVRFDDATTADPPSVNPFTTADAAARALIERADTFFIATNANGGATGDGLRAGDPTLGADVSHRGGKPGFVRFEDARTLVFPDFSGNLHFNTLGNILLDPRAGLLFVDFVNGGLVQLTGQASIVWDGEEVRAFAGAERLVRVRIDAGLCLAGSLPLRFAFGEWSPSLQATGTWAQAEETLAADRERDRFVRYVVEDVRKESEIIASFSLRREDGRSHATYEAGQFLPIRVALPGEPAPVLRTYTLSAAPSLDGAYRLSIKREPAGLVSRFFHDHVRPGHVLEAMAPRGRFVLDRSSDRPVALISAGLGITPMLAMADWLIEEGRRTRLFRETWFVHGTSSGRALAFGRHLRALARVHSSFRLHLRFSRPDADDRLGESHDSEGRIDAALLRRLLPLADVDVYLCGPTPFMQDLYDGLRDAGVADARLHYEAFGPATVLKRLPAPGIDADPAAAAAAIAVHFARSGLAARWSPGDGTLLELAERAGLAPAHGCRAGICGTCVTKLICGTVEYTQEPVAGRAPGEVLICCAEPRPASGAQSCGEDAGLVLDL